MNDAANNPSIGPGNPVQNVNRVALAIFFTVWLASGWFHQSRDWNVASRLMLVYALGDRGTVSIDGLQRQTGDLAFKDGHYYCDKAPGFSLLATPAYLLGKTLFGWSAHPTNQDGFAYWPADALVTWFSSGLATALVAYFIFRILLQKNISIQIAAFSAVLTIWASPLAVYATLAYGHQVASALLVASAWLALRKSVPAQKETLLIGLLAGFGVLTELAQAPVAVAIGLAVLAGDFRFKSISQNATGMLLGAVPSALVLLTYNFIAFGSPLDMGYFHHATQQFAKVHSAENPLGLNLPDFSRLAPLMWGEYRGLIFYVPWAALAPVGWWRMMRCKEWKFLWITLAGFMVPLWVNLSYPEWTGGWSTGPRLLVPALPWLGLAAGFALPLKVARCVAIPAWIWGFVVTTLYLGVGGRISQDIARPLRDAVWLIWSGGRLPRFWPGERFARTLPAELADYYFQFSLPNPRLWILMLAVSQACFLLILYVRLGPGGSNRVQTPQAQSAHSKPPVSQAP